MLVKYGKSGVIYFKSSSIRRISRRTIELFQRRISVILTVYDKSSEPSVRGVITAMAGISATLGLLIVFTLGCFNAWRNVAIICLIMPVVTMVAVLFVCVIHLFR